MSNKCPAPGGPRYSRPEPAEWGNLTAFAQDQLDSTAQGSVTLQDAAAMYYRMEDLDDEAREAVRYHSLGLGMCVLARELSDPEKRKIVVEHAARNLASDYSEGLQSDGKGMRPGDIKAYSAHHPFAHLMKEAKIDLPLSSQLVANSTFAYSRYRQMELSYPRSHATPHSPMVRLDKIKEGEYLRVDTGSQANAAAFRVVRYVLASIYGGLGTVEPEIEYDEQLLGPVIDTELLKSLDLTRLAANCAKLRIDEFVCDDLFPKIVHVGQNGETDFDLSYLRSEPGAPDNTELGARKGALLHKERLRCPALYVQGLIPLMMEVAPEIIVTAQENIMAGAQRKSCMKDLLAKYS